MITAREVGYLLSELYRKYDPERQKSFANAAKYYYHYKAEGRRLAAAIEEMRSSYND